MENRKEVYFDNSATTRVFDSVRDVMVEAMTFDYGNTSSRHMKGVEAERYIQEARGDRRLHEGKGKGDHFTSGGTESNNMALIGAAMAARRKGNHLITTCIEHASVYNTMSFLEEQGFRITYLPVDRGWDRIPGCPAGGHLRRHDPGLHHVCEQRDGSRGAGGRDREAHKEHPSGHLFPCGCHPGLREIRDPSQKEGIDLMSVSGHKIHGPKGVGFLYVDEKIGSSPSFSAAASRRECARGQKTFRAAPAWAWLSRRSIRTMTKEWSVCTP